MTWDERYPQIDWDTWLDEDVDEIQAKVAQTVSNTANTVIKQVLEDAKQSTRLSVDEGKPTFEICIHAGGPLWLDLQMAELDIFIPGADHEGIEPNESIDIIVDGLKALIARCESMRN